MKKKLESTTIILAYLLFIELLWVFVNVNITDINTVFTSFLGPLNKFFFDFLAENEV